MQVEGGEKLAAYLAELSQKVSKKGSLSVGFFEGKTYPNGTSVAMVAAIQNFGAPKAGIPPRPFFSNMVRMKSGSWGPTLGNILRANDYDCARSLGLLGEEIAGDLRQSIIDTNSPALSPVTVMLRGMRANDPSLTVSGKTVGEAARRVAEGKTNYGASAKPLVDQGILLNSVEYKVTS